MITAIDTNILLDILGGDPKFGPLSAAALRRCISEGAVVACEVVWAETATFFEKEGQYLKAMETLGIVFDPIDQATALKAGSAWRHYRKKRRQTCARRGGFSHRRPCRQRVQPAADARSRVLPQLLQGT